MMDVSRHRSVETLRGYVRDAELFRDHAGAGLLLNIRSNKIGELTHRYRPHFSYTALPASSAGAPDDPPPNIPEADANLRRSAANRRRGPRAVHRVGAEG